MGTMQFWRTIVFNLIIHINQMLMKGNKSIYWLLLMMVLTINVCAQRAMFVSQNNYVAPILPYQAPVIITNGLVLNLDAADPSSYSGSGNVWSTLVGSNHINFYNNNSYSTSGNPSFSTDGGGSLLTFGLYGRSIANSDISGAAARSFEAWVKFNFVGSGTSGNSIISIGNKFMNQLYEMMAYQTNLISHPYNSPFAKSSTVLNTSNWYQVVITYDGSTNHVIYINGVQVGISSAGDGSNVTLNTGNTPFYIGSGSVAMNWGSFNGKIAAVRVYNRSLSSSDVTFNFNALRSRFGL
jgi:hypothetical protein